MDIPGPEAMGRQWSSKFRFCKFQRKLLEGGTDSVREGNSGRRKEIFECSQEKPLGEEHGGVGEPGAQET